MKNKNQKERSLLYKELAEINRQWNEHNKKWNCKIDGSCLIRARAQGATYALRRAIEILGGRKLESYQNMRFDE